MKRKGLGNWLLPFFLLQGAPYAAVEIVSQKLLTEDVCVGKTAEIELRLSEEFKNPYDPRLVKVDARIKMPSREYVVPGFYYQPYALNGERKIMTHGAPSWRVRFLPVEPGFHRIAITVSTGLKKKEASELTANVKNRPWRGLVRLSKYNPALLMYENGEALHLSGLNLFGENLQNFKTIPDAWIDKDVERVGKLVANGGNTIRIRMDGWWYSIESTPRENLGYEGLGKYHQRACWEIDRLFTLCESKGVNIQLCLENAHALVNNIRYKWVDNQSFHFYNKAHGGILDRNEDFWTNEAARDFYKRKIRYVVARWGASPSLAVWEYMNELVVVETQRKNIVDWLGHMGHEFKTVDPFRRLMTFSLMGGSVEANADFWNVSNIDITQEHFYSPLARIYPFCEEFIKTFPKPFIVAEKGSDLMQEYYFGSATVEPFVNKDTEALVPHVGHWLSAFALSSGAFAWYMSYDQNESYWSDFRRLQSFLKDIPFTDPGLKTFRAQVTQDSGEPIDPPKPLVLSVNLSFNKAKENRFTVLDNGQCLPSPNSLGMLWGLAYHPQLRNPPVFKVENPRPWRFGLRVLKVYAGASDPSLVQLTLDDSLCSKTSLTLDSSQKVGSYSDLAQGTNNICYLDVPAGAHTISVDYLGKDRIVCDYLFESYVRQEPIPMLTAVGLSHKHGLDVYVYNESWNERALIGKEPFLKAKGVTLNLDLENNANLYVETTNPLSGKKVEEKRMNAINRKLVLQLGDVEKDLACRIRYIK